MSAGSTPDFATVLANAIESRLMDVHTSINGRVQSFDQATRKADVEVMTNRFLEDANGELKSEVIGVLKNVRVAVPKSGDWFFNIPIAPGTTGQIFFTERSCGQWQATGEVSDPDDVGVLSMSGASFYPGGLITDSEASELGTLSNSGITVGKKGGAQIIIENDGTFITKNTPLAQKVPVAKSDVVDSFMLAVDTVLTAIDTALLGGAWATAKLEEFPDEIPPGAIPPSGSDSLEVE